MEENTNKPKKKSKKSLYISIAVVVVVLILVFVIWFFMKGEVKTTGNYPNDVTPESLSCKARNIDYEYFGNDKVTSSNNVQINAIFYNNKIDTISLVRKMTYLDADTAKIWSDAHEGNMNLSFYSNNMGSYSLGATYTIDNNVAQMSLYAKTDELNDTSIKYFMLDKLPKNMDEYKKGYSEKGFTCEVVKGSK